jgi:tripartite-type tricarboxylate transporter receptor subunit TctC
LLFLIAGAAAAQWPARPVKLVVPSSAGGGTDFYARLLAQALGDALHQQFIVENLPGGSGARDARWLHLPRGGIRRSP